MKKLQFNKPFAIIAALLIVLCTSFIKSQITFASFSNKAYDVYTNGYHDDGLSIKNDSMKKVSYAKNLVSIASKYLKDDNPSILVLNQAINSFDENRSISEEAHASTLLDGAFNELIAALNNQELTQKDSDYVLSFKADYDGRNDMIKRDKYHEYVLSLMNETTNFPASFLYQFSHNKLEVFDGGIE